MEEIKVGEYVRTKTGKIYKIDKIDKCPICKEKEYINIEIKGDLHFENTYHKKDIVKHSPNIIDLIEEGDYVNGMEVIKIGSEHREIKVLYYNGYYTDNLTLTEADINSVVTKEQFNQMEYIVGDERNE